MQSDHVPALALIAGVELLREWMERPQDTLRPDEGACELKIYLKGGAAIELRADAVRPKYNSLGELVGLDLADPEPELVHLDFGEVAAVVAKRIDARSDQSAPGDRAHVTASKGEGSAERIA